MTASALRALEALAGQTVGSRLARAERERLAQLQPASGGASPSAAAGPAAVANVRVNEPAQDVAQLDQTTQSETTVAVVGTNVAVGFCVGLAGVVGHLPGGVDWTVLLAGSLASIPGALLGARLTGRLSEERLLQAIGAVLVVAGCATLAQGLA
jgi:hypothetical protein